MKTYFVDLIEIHSFMQDNRVIIFIAYKHIKRIIIYVIRIYINSKYLFDLHLNELRMSARTPLNLLDLVHGGGHTLLSIVV